MKLLFLNSYRAVILGFAEAEGWQSCPLLQKLWVKVRSEELFAMHDTAKAVTPNAIIQVCFRSIAVQGRLCFLQSGLILVIFPLYTDLIWIMYVGKYLVQRKAKISSFQSSVAKTYFSLGDLGAFFKVTYSRQKLKYKDHVSAAHLRLPGMALWETACVCQLSCPGPEPAQLYAATAPCAKQKQVVDTHPPVPWGLCDPPFPQPQLLWHANCGRWGSTVPRSTLQWGDSHCLARSSGSNMQIPLLASLIRQIPPRSFGLYLHLFHRKCDCNLGWKSHSANAC